MTQQSTPWARFACVSLVAILLGLTCGLTVRAQTPVAPDAAPRPGFVDKKLGEEEEIRLRDEWFYGPRKVGVSSDEELWSLRLAAVKQTRQALAAQRARQALGAEAGQNVWVEMGPSPSNFGGWTFGTVSGRIQAIAADWAGGVLYAGAGSGGVWKSTNNGASWTSVFETAGTLAVGAIHLDPNDPDIVWVGTGDNISGCESYFGIGLLRSPDGGQTWEERNGSGSDTLQDLSSFASVTVDPRDSNKIVVGGRYRGCTSGSQQEGGIFTTQDGGLTWDQRMSFTQVHEIARDPMVPDILWAGTNSGIFKSVNNGQNWFLQTASGLPSGNMGRTEIAIAPSDPDTVYALFDDPSDEFWRTTDGGASWTKMNADACDGQCSYNMVIRVDPNNENIVYRGTIRIWKSGNGGTSWEVLTNTWGGAQQVHQDTHSLLMHPTLSGTFYVGSDGGLWGSTNGGLSFNNHNGNMNVTQFYAIGVDASDPGRICGGAQDNSSLARDGSNVWERQAVTGDGFVCYIDPIDPDYAYITSYPSGGYPNVWRSNNGLFGGFGDVTGSGSGIIGGDRINWVTPYILDPTSPNIMYLGTHRAYRSDNRGSSWTQVGPNDLTASSWSSLRVLEVNRNFPTYIFSGATSGAVYHSVDSGSNWTNITSGLPGRAINDIGADPTNPDRAFAAVSGFNAGHVWEWNAGAGWTDRSNGLPNVPANSVLLLTDMDILVGTDTGVFRSTDGGLNFLPFMAGLPEGLVISDLKFNDQQNVVTAGTYARGAWQVAIGAVQPILLSNSVEQPLTEIDGDGDDRIEPGETWSVRPILQNAGGETAFNVTAQLSSSTPGVTILNPSGNFGDLDPGVPTPVFAGYQFSVDPAFVCGTEIIFDLVGITSSTPPGNFTDQTAIYSVLVQDGNGAPIVNLLFQDDFEAAFPSVWPHEAVDADVPGCAAVNHVDEWGLAVKDATHNKSAHCGAGPGNTYAEYNYAWLNPFGKDSDGGAGIVIPAEALAASMTVIHWYDTVMGQDGGQVALDISDNGQDLYTTLSPVGGYPGGLIDSGQCNGLEGQVAFQGSSGGWITSQFDLSNYKGSRVWPTFVFGSDRRVDAGEGWYIDEVRIEFQTIGEPACDVARWPGTVSTAHFDRIAPGMIEATWGDACNVGEFPGQAYSIQAGDLDALAGGGTYTHTPVDALCDHLSTTTFAPGLGNEYYLVVPAGDGREGGAGADSSGTDRPQPGGVCGLRRVGCP